MSNNTIYSASRVFTENNIITTKKLLRENKSPKECINIWPIKVIDMHYLQE